jgi:hypothetical protein
VLMANQKIQHRFVVTHADEPQAAYLLAWSSEWYSPAAPGSKEGVGEFSAWTTLDAAKRAARALSGRTRISWVEEGEGAWSAACVQIQRGES